VAIQYAIEDGVLVLWAAPEGFAYLRDALHAAHSDPAARLKMPLLIDARSEPDGIRYEDVHSRVLILAQMRERFGHRWAILTGMESVRVGVGKMFRAFSEAEGLDIGMFADKDEALHWLKQSTG
jgi:hypothetical protein